MISVCMTTYNGEKYIAEQLQSIAPQLTMDDEIIVVDDGSTDNTLNIIRTLAIPNVQLYQNEVNLGYAKNFEKAMSLATGDYIVLSDQDDIWLPGKIKTARKYLDDGFALVVHDAVTIAADGSKLADSWWKYAKVNPHQNLLGNLYLNALAGCTMSISKELRDRLIPIPTSLEAHDQWIFLVAKMERLPIKIVEEPFIKYRRHGENNSGVKRRPIWTMIKGRLGAVSGMLQYKLNKRR